MRTEAVSLSFRMLLVFAVALTLGGCAARMDRTDNLISLEQLGRASEAEKETYWWYARFRIAWPEGQPVNSSVSLLLAHAVIGPVLEEHSESLPRWRFHRRAVRDTGGHQFSFIFYSDSETAERIFETFNTNSILDKAISAGLVDSVIMDDPDNPSRPRPGDTSDGRWSVTLQEHWPAYIMGVSALWLGLIDDQISDASLSDDADIEVLLDAYTRAGERINEIWYREGQHALLHHLNALFGYEPLLIRKELRF